MRISEKLVGLLICFAAFLPARAQEQTATLTENLQQKLDQIVAENGFPGATIAIAFGDGATLDIASGFADPQASQEMRVGARMFCGSTGKTFVSAVALQLVSESKLELADLASKYFESERDREWFAKLPNSKDITVHSLMNHTSGLPRYIFQQTFLDDLNANPLKRRSPRDNLSLLHGVEPLHPVGGGWAYSDSNYLVLGLIIEQVTGESYYEAARKRLLDPLGLTNTIPATQPRIQGLIQGHIGSANPFGLPRQTLKDGAYALNPEFEWCGGGYVTNAADLANWLFALHSGKVLNDDAYALLIEPVDFATGQPAEQGYGLGTFVWRTDNGLYYGHAGVMPGYLTQIEYSRDHQMAIAMQVNSDEGMGRGMHGHVQSLAKLVIAAKISAGD